MLNKQTGRKLGMQKIFYRLDLVYNLDIPRTILRLTKALTRRIPIQPVSILFIFLWCIQYNLLHANSSGSSDSKRPPITITTDQSAIEHLLEAQILIDIGEYKKSILYINAISQSYQGNNREIEARILGSLARNHLRLGLNNKAIKLWKRAIEFTNNIPNEDYLKATFNNNIALALINIRENQKARNALHKALKTYPIAETYQLLSKLAIDSENDFELSKMYLDNGLNFIEQNPIKRKSNTFREKLYRACIISGYGYYYLKKGDYSTALEKYLEVLTISKDIQHFTFEVKTLKQLGEIHQSLGNPIQSNSYFTMYLNLNDSLMRAKSRSVNFILQDLIEDNNKSKNIIALNTKNRKHKLIVFTVILIILVITIYIIVRTINQKKSLKIYTTFNEENLKLKKRLDKEFDLLVAMAKSNDTSFLSKFKQVYPGLYKKLTSLSVELTNSEIGLCAMIWLKFSTKEIAQYTFVEHKSIQIKKYRLRKKLLLPKGTDLYWWMSNL